jgi:hypothetical protein
MNSGDANHPTSIVAGDVRGPKLPAHAKQQVRVVQHGLVGVVAQAEVDRHPGPARTKGGQRPSEMDAPVGRRGGEADEAVRLERRLAAEGLEFLVGGQQARGALVDGLADGSQRDAARRAQQQPHAQQVFQLLHRPGHDRGRHVQRRRCTGEGTMLHHRLEDGQRLQPLHGDRALAVCRSSTQDAGPASDERGPS